MTLGDEDVAIRCAVWTHEQQVDPIGSAGTYDTVVLVEWPLPWPRDVGDLEVLGPFASRQGTRMLLVLPEETGRDLLVTVWKRSTTGFDGHDHRVPHDGLAEALAAILDDGTVGDPAPPDVLICGHGQRDRCCGSLGVRLLAACQGHFPDVRIRRCSHTGGHRFAPTGLTFPTGRMWAYLDVDILEQIVGETGDVLRLLPHYRGSMALDPDGQVAERAAFGHFGWPWLSQSVAASTRLDPLREEREVELTWTGPLGEGRAVARIAEGRTLPVPACGAPIHMSKKETAEPQLLSFELEPQRP